MMPTPQTMRWIELAAAVVTGGALVLFLIGLLFLRTLRRRGSRRPRPTLWGRIEARAAGARAFVEVDQLDVEQTLTIQAVLQRGWSPEMVEQVLGRPDYAVLDPQRRQEPLRLYDRTRVARAEQGKRFRSFQAEMAARHAHSEARIRKWIELRGQENEDAEPARHDG